MSQATETPITAPQPEPPTTPSSPIVDEPLFEIVDGERLELPPKGANEVWIAMNLVQWMGWHARTHQLGRVVGELLFRLGPDRPQRRPDVAFVSFARWPKGQAIPPGEAWEVVPDLAVEVVSPSNTSNEILGKIGEYFEAGVRHVWVVYPEFRQVYVYDSPLTPHVVGPEGTLEAEQVVPGFRLTLADLFEDAGGPAPTP